MQAILAFLGGKRLVWDKQARHSPLQLFLGLEHHHQIRQELPSQVPGTNDGDQCCQEQRWRPEDQQHDTSVIFTRSSDHFLVLLWLEGK